MKDKKTLIYSLIGISAFILVLVGATFAYFTAQGGKASQTDISVKTSTTDSLVFSTGDDISFTAIQSTFKKGDGNKAGSTYAKAVLKANDSTNHATANYYVYLDITNNDFEYTTDTSTAELLLTVIDPDGNPITEIEGLNYVTVNGLSGFDVTIKTGLLKLVDNHEIVSEGTKEEKWDITLTLVNLDSDQSRNAGKNFNASIEITKEPKKDNLKLADYVKAQYTTQGANNLYLHDGTLENGANDGSYRYAGSSETTNNFVCFGYDSTDGTCPTDNLYRIIGVFDKTVKLIKYDYANDDLLGTDGDYDGSFANKFNGTTEYYKGYKKSSSLVGYNCKNISSTSWSELDLNKINLNTNYLNNIGSKWSDLITTYTWQVGGGTGFFNNTVSVVYQNEIGTPVNDATYEAKIGLMYVSEYGYAAAPSAWTTTLSSYNSSSITSANWMYMGLMEATIYPNLGVNTNGHCISFGGNLCPNFPIPFTFTIRPTFYLNESVLYKSGNGTMSSPIIIN